MRVIDFLLFIFLNLQSFFLLSIRFILLIYGCLSSKNEFEVINFTKNNKKKILFKIESKKCGAMTI